MSLTAKRQAFVREYPIDLNATKAAIRAGFSEKTAYSQGQRLLKNVEVAAAIQKALAERSERTEITQDYVLTSIMETMEQRKGTGEHSNPNAVLKGAELLGRHLAMFTDKKTVTHHDGDRLDAVLERMGENAKPIGHPRSH
jgi:phage terminase small subunit